MSQEHWNRLSYECELWGRGLARVAGVDEAGCGPLAGPVVAAAVVFPCHWLTAGLCGQLRGLNDSKQLTEAQRERSFEVLQAHPEIQSAVVEVGVELINRINIRQAAWRAMSLALDRLKPRPEHVLVDGLRIKWLAYEQTALAQGDARSYTDCGRQRPGQGDPGPPDARVGYTLSRLRIRGTQRLWHASASGGDPGARPLSHPPAELRPVPAGGDGNGPPGPHARRRSTKARLSANRSQARQCSVMR